MLSTLDNMIYLITTDRLKRLNFQFISMNIGVERTANYIEVPMLFRNDPINIYTGGSSTLNFTLDLVSDREDRKDVKEKVTFLQKLTYSDYKSKELPKKVILVWGNDFLLGDNAWIITSVKPKYNLFDKVYDYNGTSCLIDIQMKADNDVNINRSDL